MKKTLQLKTEKEVLDFRNKIVNYIIGYLEDNNILDNIKKYSFTNYLFQPTNNNNNFPLKYRSIIFNNIDFPEIDTNNELSYINVLQKLDKISFIKCTFNISILKLSGQYVHFDNCRFSNKWTISEVKFNNSTSAIFNNCIFKKKVVIINTIDNVLKYPLFSDCNFYNELNFENSTLDYLIFNNSINEIKTQMCKINKIIIKNCTFQKRFILNNYKINDLLIENSEINDKLEFKYNKVTNFGLINTNFQNIVDCFKTTFINFEIKKCIFNEYVGFEECTFGSNRNLKEDISKFIHSTFLTFINFRNAKFNSGLDLQQINLKEPPNFLNAHVSEANTNRETFRIIKYSFDKIGNIIEANRFYAHEMHKYKEDLKNGNTSKDWIGLQLLRLYKCFSNYGQSIWRPLIWIIIFAITNMFINYGYENNLLYKVFPNFWLANCIAQFLNEFAKSIIPFKNLLKPEMEFISLLFYIIFASLIWLVILAIKRRTKR